MIRSHRLATVRFAGGFYKLAEWLDDKPHDYLKKELEKVKLRIVEKPDEIPANMLPELWLSRDVEETSSIENKAEKIKN